MNLLIFAGPGSSGKAIAIYIANHFYFEFYQAVSILWNDNVFFVMAHSGLVSAAIFKVMFLKRKIELLDDGKT